jgi:hypothetical protein
MTVRGASPKWGSVVEDFSELHADAECENCELDIHLQSVYMDDPIWVHENGEELCVTDLPPKRGDPDSWFAIGGHLRYLCVKCGCTRTEEDGDNRVDEWCDDGECPCHRTRGTL